MFGSRGAHQRYLEQGTALVFVQLLFCALLGSTASDSEIAAAFAISGFGITAVCFLLIFLIRRQQSTVAGYCVLVHSCLFTFLPFGALAGGVKSALPVTLYLCALLLLPLALKLYSSQMHTYTVLSIALTAAIAHYHHPLVSSDELILVGIAAVLSVVFAWRKSLLSGDQFRQEESVYKEYYDVQAMTHAWQCLILQASVLLLLLFLDLVRGPTNALPIQLKLIGLASLIISAYLMTGIRKESVAFRMTVSTLLVGTVVSLSTMWNDDQFALYAALPTLYILGLTSVSSWSPARHLGIVAYLATVDLALRLGSELSTQNRAAIIVVSLGAVVAIASGRIRIYFHQPEVLNGAAARSELNTPVIGLTPLRDQLLSTQLRRAVLYQRWYAGCAILLCSYLVSHFAVSSFWLVLVGVAVLLLLQGGCQTILTREKYLNLGWGLNFCSFAVAALWSGIPLLYFSSADLFFFYWVLTVTLGIALCPWRLHELITIGLLTSLIAFESIEHVPLSLDKLSAAYILLAAALIISRTLEFWLRESLLTRIGFDALDRASTVKECEQHLSEILLMYADAQIAFHIGSSGRFLHITDRTYRDSEFAAREAFSKLESHLTFTKRSSSVESAVSNLRAQSQRHPEVDFFRQNQEHALILRINFACTEEVYSAVIVLLRPLPFLGSVGVLSAAHVVLELARLRISQLLDGARTEQIRDELRKLDALREYELSAMVHDINNTVQDLTLLCESIRDEVSEGSEARSVISDIGLIEGTARSIAHIVSDAKRRRELEQLEDLQPREVVDVGDLVCDVVSFARLRAERKGISVELENTLSTVCLVRISVREHLEAVMRNILQNAIAYSSKDSLITVRLSMRGNEVAIDVTDNGIGLTEVELHCVFDQGYRGRVRDSAHGGLGLGLAQSRRVIAASGGRLEVASSGPGKGSVFSVVLPRAQAPIHHQEGEWALLVDDEPRLITYYERLVVACGLVAHSASTSADAVKILETYGRPTLVITDLHLGVDEGEQVIAEVRSRFGQTIPILVITGIRDTERTNRARTAGATEVIYKPIGQHALYARIESSIPRERTTQKNLLEKESSHE